MTQLNGRRGWQVNRWYLLVVAIALEWGVCSAAVSQDQAEATDTETLDVVTVTAQRRVENLQATPISIVTTSGETRKKCSLPLITLGFTIFGPSVWSPSTWMPM